MARVPRSIPTTAGPTFWRHACWPADPGRRLAVVDMGIGGNRILHEGAASKRPQFGINALARFDQDVLAQPGVSYLMILEGINDIGHAGSSAPASEAVTAEDIIAGLTQMIERAHEKGIKVIVATITPFEGEGNIKRGYWTPEKAKVREAVNSWIRSGKGFDGFVDFDKAVRDPANPNKILPAFDSGDQLHPGDAGYKAMGEADSLDSIWLEVTGFYILHKCPHEAAEVLFETHFEMGRDFARLIGRGGRQPAVSDQCGSVPADAPSGSQRRVGPGSHAW